MNSGSFINNTQDGIEFSEFVKNLDDLFILKEIELKNIELKNNDDGKQPSNKTTKW